MQVILLERVEKLGLIGEIVNVKPGYARNFLLPQGKALRASKSNQEAFELRRVQIEADNLQQREEAERTAEMMKGMIISVVRQASDAGMLYGSVNSRDVAEGVTAEGVTISRSQVVQEGPIKMLGIHDIRIRLHPEVSTLVKVNVAKSADEAQSQLINEGLLEDPSVLEAIEDEMEEEVSEEQSED